MRHLKLAFRMLRKTPFVTSVAVLSLALGIGANAAIYSMFAQMLLKPLPVQEPNRLVNLSAPGPKMGSTSCNQAGSCEDVFSYPMLKDLQREQKVFTGIAAHVTFGANLAVRNEPVATQGMLVSGSYFPVLGIKPVVGRLLSETDDDVIGAHFVTVLSHAFWLERFGGDVNVVGKTMVVNGQTFTIIGVAPRDFTGTTMGSMPSVYVPLTMRGVVLNRPTLNFENRRSYFLYLFGRLKPGVTLEQAQTSLNGVYTPILVNVEAALQQGVSDQTLKQFKERKIVMSPGFRGQSSIFKEASTPLYLLFGITGIVLLIACANIANLLLARGASRATEMGVRLALGANRRQLLTQLLTESLVLAFMGGLASLLIAKWTLDGIGALMPDDVNSTLQFKLQPSVVFFAAGVALVTGVLFGLFPALHSTRSDLVSAIRAGAGQIAGARAASRFRAALVTLQIAMSMALLVSANLFLKSLSNVAKVDLGLKVDHLATFTISPSRSGYDTLRAAVLFGRLEDELAALPGVTGVTTSTVPLLSGSNWGTDMRVQGFQSGPDIDSNARYNEVGAGYFTLLGIKLLAGRDFVVADGARNTKVAIVNQAFAKKFKMGNDVVGKYMSMGGDSLDTQIVGYIQDAKYSDVKDSIPPLAYIPWRQDTRAGNLSYYVQTTLPPEKILRSIPDVMKRLDPMVPVEDLKTMPQQVKENVFLDRMISILSAAFAVLATLLAAVGLYGVLAYSVAQRTREIGVRMALGARAGHVRGLVLRQMSWMLLIGGAIGIAAALGLGRAAQSLLFGIQGHDPIVFMLSIVLLCIIAMSAGYLPSRRAVKVDPMRALRYD